MSAKDDRRRILVVDDEPSVRQLLQTFLGCAGFEVETAESGAAALARLEKQEFDALVTDEAMPGMRGCELVAQVHTRWPTFPIVMFAGMEPETLPVGLAKFLHKPSDFGQLPGTLFKEIQARPRG